MPHRTDWDRRESVDTTIIPRMGEIGFFGLTIPEKYGGLGGDHLTYCLGMEELGRADSTVCGIVSVSSGLFGKLVLAHGTEEQKQQWLPGIATGTWADVAVVFARTGSEGPRGDQGPFGRTSQRMASGGSGRT